MKTKCICFCFISFFSAVYLGTAQEKNVKATDSLTVKKSKPHTIRFGIDLFKPVYSQFTESYYGLELVGDILVWKDLYAAIEIGNEKTTLQSEQVNFTSSGSYLKFGIDYNMFENWEGMNNQIYIGLRVARSLHKQRLNSYSLYLKEHLWPENLVENGYATGLREGLSATWFEIVAGVKVALVKNVYLGFSLRLNQLLSDAVPKNFDNIFIPGFNKKTKDSRFSAGFNYTLTYSIPVWFKRK